MERNPELEAKLIEDPNDTAAYVVYADWLQARGDPRGEWMMLELQNKTDEAQALFEEREEALLGPLLAYATSFDGMELDAFTYRLGFIRSARLSYDSYNAGDDISLEAGLAELLTHPLGALLEELIVPINMVEDGCYFEPIVKTIAEYGAPALRRLRMGEFQVAGPGGVQNGYDYEISWSMLGDTSGMWRKLPRLEYLRIQSGLGSTSVQSDHPDRFGPIHLPALRHLEIVTGGMGQECLRSLADAEWPALETMELWLGSSSYGFEGTVDDVERILGGEGLPKLERLGLMNTELSDEIATRLGHSKILRRLRSLDLSYGTLTDEGARALAATREAFAHLSHLALDENFLTAEGIDVVQGLCPNVTTERQKEPWEEGERYVSLSE